MAIWHNTPPDSEARTNFQMLRTPPKGQLQMIVLSAAHAGTMLHYWKGRSTPCNMATCDACKNGYAPRWYGYIYAMSRKTKRIIIFEFPERPVHVILERISQHKSLRGHTLCAQRTGNRPNSPVNLEFTDQIHDEQYLPNPIDLEDVLERMWEVKNERPLFKELPGQQRFDLDELNQATNNSSNGKTPK